MAKQKMHINTQSYAPHVATNTWNSVRRFGRFLAGILCLAFAAGTGASANVVNTNAVDPNKEVSIASANPAAVVNTANFDSMTAKITPNGKNEGATLNDALQAANNGATTKGVPVFNTKLVINYVGLTADPNNVKNMNNATDNIAAATITNFTGSSKTIISNDGINTTGADNATFNSNNSWAVCANDPVTAHNYAQVINNANKSNNMTGLTVASVNGRFVGMSFNANAGSKVPTFAGDASITAVENTGARKLLTFYDRRF